MAHKSKKQPANNDRANKSFQSRYGMSKSEWSHTKRKMTGVERDKVRKLATKRTGLYGK